MSRLAALEAQAAAEIATFDYPSKEWMPPSDTALNVAIAGYGHVGLLLALALRRERINCVTMFRAPLDRMGVYAALIEPGRPPRLDFAGRELSVPSLGLPAWLRAQNLSPGDLFGAALAAQWLEYLDWLARQVGVELSDDGASHGLAIARHGVIAWSAADVPYGCLAGDLTAAISGAGVAIQGDDAAAHDLALTALALGAEWVTLRCDAEAAVPAALLEAHDVVHAFPLLTPERQAALRSAAHRIATPPPAAWQQRLRSDARVRTDSLKPDVTLIPGERLPPIVPTDIVLNADLSMVGRPSLSLLCPAASGPAAPVLHPLSLARFGVPIVNAAISRAIFLADADPLFREFLAFESAEGLGGRLLM